MAGCPCASLKRGAACLAVAASIAVQPRIFLAGDLVPSVTAALHGTASLATAVVLIGWLVLAADGVFESLQGYRAAQSHRDYFDAGMLVTPLAVGLLCLYALYSGWSLPPSWGAVVAALSWCALLAAVAYNAAGVWLQLRGPVALLFAQLVPQRHAPLPDNSFFGDWFPQQDSGAAAQLAECREIMDSLALEVEQLRGERDLWRQERVTWQETVGARERIIRDIAAERDQFAIERDHFAATRDRYQSNGKRIKAEKLQLEAEKLQLETICKFPGVKKALVKATHPDTGTGGDVRSRTKIFQALQAVYDRIEGR